MCRITLKLDLQVLSSTAPTDRQHFFFFFFSVSSNCLLHWLWLFGVFLYDFDSSYSVNVVVSADPQLHAVSRGCRICPRTIHAEWPWRRHSAAGGWGQVIGWGAALPHHLLPLRQPSLHSAVSYLSENLPGRSWQHSYPFVSLIST